MDLWAGELLLELKQQPAYEEIELIVVLPYTGHDSHWDTRNKERLAYLLRYCTIYQTGTQNELLRAKASNEVEWINKVDQHTNGQFSLIAWSADDIKGDKLLVL